MRGATGGYCEVTWWTLPCNTLVDRTDGTQRIDLPLTRAVGSCTHVFKYTHTHTHARAGSGCSTDADGDSYTGSWHRGKRHGHGEYTFADGYRQPLKCHRDTLMATTVPHVQGCHGLPLCHTFRVATAPRLYAGCFRILSYCATTPTVVHSQRTHTRTHAHAHAHVIAVSRGTGEELNNAGLPQMPPNAEWLQACVHRGVELRQTRRYVALFGALCIARVLVLEMCDLESLRVWVPQVNKCGGSHLHGRARV